MGGAFGGKETRSVFIACTAALAAQLLNRPVAILIERDVDMSITGQRHAFQYSYKAGMLKDGTLRYLDCELFCNAGFSQDLSQPVMDRALLHIDNCYRWPALRVVGKVCKTNQPSHTAFRGFGGPQGLAVCENVLQHLSEKSGIPLDVLKLKNLYAEGDVTHFGQTLELFTVPSLWAKIYNLASVMERRAAIVQFNSANRWRKRGLCVLPTKFGINFTAKFMNQVCVCVCVCMCMYVCMHVCVYVFIYVCMYVCIYVYMYVCMYVCFVQQYQLSVGNSIMYHISGDSIYYLCIYASMNLCIYASMYLCIYVSMYVVCL
jgi:xanthine dehydrogenase/oxidase